ncbi:MAG: LCP family protein [Propionibacteriaceae bacterium]|jgi:LCP family protein required for cell wall assembly|nr:LCP family protein [Propionibacteriaceae bacterium]
MSATDPVGRRSILAPPRPRPQRRLALIVIAVLSLIILLAASDVIALVSRVERVDLPRATLAVADAGQTWVIVGSDNRDWTVGDDSIYGRGATRVGDHADIVIVIHQTPQGNHALVLPRDLWVTPADGQTGRLTMMMARSPATFAEAMCLTLGIPVDHLLMVRMSTFVNVIDAIGGVAIDFPYDTRDAESNLSIGAGRQQLDGAMALAFVRSRQAEQLIDGQWVGVDKITGASKDRPTAAAQVMSQLVTRIKSERNPLVWQSLAWSLSGGSVIDRNSSLLDLPGLIGALDEPITVLPVSADSGKIVDLPSDASWAALTAAGYARAGCQIGG